MCPSRAVTVKCYITVHGCLLENVGLHNIYVDSLSNIPLSNLRPFQWYLDEVYPSNALNLVQSALAVGKLKNVATGLCLYVSDLSWAKYNQALTLRPCVDNAHGQSFVYSSQRDIRSASLIDKCIDYSPSKV